MEFGHLSWTTGRAEAVALSACLMPRTPSQMTMLSHDTIWIYYMVAQESLDTHCKLSEPTVCQICCAPKACVHGEPDMTGLSDSPHASVCANAAGC